MNMPAVQSFRTYDSQAVSAWGVPQHLVGTRAALFYLWSSREVSLRPKRECPTLVTVPSTEHPAAREAPLVLAAQQRVRPAPIKQDPIVSAPETTKRSNFDLRMADEFVFL